LAKAGRALIGFPDERQRIFRVGRAIMPGLGLEEIGQHHAVLASASGPLRLALGKSEEEGTAETPARAVIHNASFDRSGDEHRQAMLDHRLGLEPRRQQGRITGFAVRQGARLPVLERAGLRPGDVLVSVNGQAFDSEEKVLELSLEMAGSRIAEFEFERDGRRMKASLQINP
jgi:general secretion pathway protein C